MKHTITAYATAAAFTLAAIAPVTPALAGKNKGKTQTQSSAASSAQLNVLGILKLNSAATNTSKSKNKGKNVGSTDGFLTAVVKGLL